MIQQNKLKCRYCNKPLGNMLEGINHICIGIKADWDKSVSIDRKIFKNGRRRKFIL